MGTIDAYYEANMDLRSVSPALNLYNREWPLRTTSYPDPPAKFTFDDENRRGQAIDTIVSGGCILSGGMVRNSVLGRGVRVHAGALVEDCVILDNCDIGRRAKMRRAILDKNVRVPEDAMIGYDLERDRAHGYHVTESGIVVVGGEPQPGRIISLVVCVGSTDGTTGPRVDHAVRLPGDLLAAGARHRRAAGARRDAADFHRLPGLHRATCRCRWPCQRRSRGSACGITISYILGRTFGLEADSPLRQVPAHHARSTSRRRTPGSSAPATGA